MKNKQTLKDSLGDFLFNQIQKNTDYQSWAKEFELPTSISDNLAKPLRDYQINAVKHFIYLYENYGLKTAKHVLFNMATGTGKTLTMAAIVLYLYEHGYRHFVFLVHQVQIKNQAIKNFTDPTFDKYLFKKIVKINGKNIAIKAADQFHHNANKDGIYFLFFSTQMLYKRLTEIKENSICPQDFKKNLTVIIADEAHRLNVDTRKKLKQKEQEDIQNWETAVNLALNAHDKNLLLEFTATVDLKNEAIRQKYSDKLIYQYNFWQFNQDGYSKDVQFLFNEETQIIDQKRLLIVNAVALSEYRRLLAEREMDIIINPIILIKSTAIKQSEADRDFFHQVINGLKIQDFDFLKQQGKEKKDSLDNQPNFISLISQMFYWLKTKSGLANKHDLDGLQSFIQNIKQRFAKNNSLIYNSKDKERADLLPLLDSPKNTIRAIFSVNALNEGWDVLSLYDIIHFDISASKKVSLQDIQLIGRGARLYPYHLPKVYHKQDLFNHFDTDPYKRKFDRHIDDNGRMLETFVYHFVKTGNFLNDLQKDLLDEGIINQGVEKRTIYLKDNFLNSQTYKQGFVLVNEVQYRSKNQDSEINATFHRQIIAKSYQLHSHALSDKQQNQQQANIQYKSIKISGDYFSKHLVKKALIMAENNFFRLNNLKKHIIGIGSIDEMIEHYLPMYDIQYQYSANKDIDKLSAQEKLQLLVGSILPEVRKSIDKHLPIIIGSPIFKPKSLAQVFGQQKNIYLVAYPTTDNQTGETTYIAPDERAKAQSNHDKAELNYNIATADWYAYSENYGTSEEKRFVKLIADYIDDLKQQYPSAEIFLIRNELDYYVFGLADGRKFSPDYLLIINDNQNKSLYYQCLIEPKGEHLLQKDAWKEQVLLSLNSESMINMGNFNNQNYQQIQCLGFKFFNHQQQKAFLDDFKDKLNL